jgi:hypothetical protein
LFEGAEYPPHLSRGEPLAEKPDVIPVFKGCLEIPAHKGIPVRGKQRPLGVEVVIPGEDILLPEVLLGLWADAWDVDKGSFQHGITLFFLSQKSTFFGSSEKQRLCLP